MGICTSFGDDDVERFGTVIAQQVIDTLHAKHIRVHPTVGIGSGSHVDGLELEVSVGAPTFGFVRPWTLADERSDPKNYVFVCSQNELLYITLINAFSHM